MIPLLPPGSLSDSPDANGRPASRLEIQARVLRTQRLRYAAEASVPPERSAATGRLAAVTGSLRDAVGTALIAAGERIRPCRPEAATSGTHAS